MRHLTHSLALTLVALLAVPAAHAQDDQEDDGPPMMVLLGFHKCHNAMLGDLIDQNRERGMSHAQALVDEGAAAQIGQARHAWGDEYNLLTWMAAPGMDGVLAAFDAMNARMAEAYGDDLGLYPEACTQHRDAFYAVEGMTDDPADAPPPTEGESTIALSFYTCDYDAMGDVLEDELERALPIAQGLVDEGALRGRTVLTHRWGDEWNYLVATSGDSLPAILAGLDALGERYEAAYGADARNPLDEHCSAHKDNVYALAMVTEDPDTDASDTDASDAGAEGDE